MSSPQDKSLAADGGACATEEPSCPITPWHTAILVCLVVMLSGLGAYQMLDPDESRYAEVPREMLESGDFITPRLNYVPYLEKPPLHYWATALSFRAFGQNVWALRLVPAVCGILGLVIVWWLTLLCFGPTAARWAPGIMASTPLFFVASRAPTTDMLLSVLLAAALTAWLAGDQRERRSRLALWGLSGLLLGLAQLTKGPVVLVLFGGIVLVYLLLVRRPRALLVGLGLPLTLACLVFLPWVLAVQKATPLFFHHFFVVQHLERFLGSGNKEHVQPVYYHVAVVLLGFGLWSLYWPGMLKAIWRTCQQRQLWPARLRGNSVFLLVWTLAVIVFFTASSCKLALYTLSVWWPIAAAMAVWMRREFCRGEPRRRLYVPTVIGAGAVALTVLAAIIGTGRQSDIPLAALQRPLLIFSLSGVLSFGLLISTSWLRNRHWSVTQLIVAALLPLAGILPAMAAISAHKDMAGLVPAQLHALPKSSPWILAQYMSYNQSLNFYTHRRVILIGTASEITLGLEQPDADQWFLKDEQSIRSLSRRGPLALVTHDELAERLCLDYDLHLWRRNNDRAILFNEAGMALLHAPAHPTSR